MHHVYFVLYITPIKSPPLNVVNLYWPGPMGFLDPEVTEEHKGCLFPFSRGGFRAPRPLEKGKTYSGF